MKINFVNCDLSLTLCRLAIFWLLLSYWAWNKG